MSVLKTVMITGANGFVGRNLQAYLQQRSDWQVIPVNRQLCDLRDESAVSTLFKDQKVDFVVHCANTGGSRKSGDLPGALSDNLRMFFNLVRAIGSGTRLIQMGSGAEYDVRYYRPKMPEDYFDRHIPVDDYGFAKYVISKFIGRELNMTCLRIFGLYGRYEDYTYKFISNAIVKNLISMPITINRNVVFDYLHIEDFVRIVESIMLRWPAKRHINMTPTHSIDLVSLARMISEIGEYHGEIKVINHDMGCEYTGDNTLLLQEIGEFEFTPYERGITELYAYYRQEISRLDLETVRSDPFLTASRIAATMHKSTTII